MKASEIMTANPACCSPDDDASAAAQLMEKNDCGCIPVVEGERAVGVITDRDIALRGVARGRSPDTQVRELMTSSTHCCNADSDVEEVEKLMSDRQVRRVLVVDGDQCVVGIVAQADIARAAERGSDLDRADVGRVVEQISEPTANRDARLA